MSQSSGRLWAELGADAFDALDKARAVAILPVAAVEQHGPHLPLSVDACINEGVLNAALALLAADDPVLVLPPQVIGKSEEHLRFAGTLSAPAESLIRQWNEIGDGVARAGIRKLLFFNSHGGNPPVMEIVSRDLRGRHDMLAVTANWYDLAPLGDWFAAGELKHGIHGGEVETSVMLHLRPDLVNMAKASDFVSSSVACEREFDRLSPLGPTSYAWETQDLNPSGAVGNAAAADAGRGEQAVNAAAAELAALLRDMLRADPDRLIRRR
ncbi:MAG: creatininase family protein [Alphaproteobacteria bacterium]